MELKERFSVLIQGAHIAQSKGVLSLDDAVVVKNAIGCVEENVNLEEAAKILIRVAEMGQEKGCYTLKDAHYLYVALHEIFDVLLATPVPEDEEKEKDGE